MSICYAYQTLIPVVLLETTETQRRRSVKMGFELVFEQRNCRTGSEFQQCSNVPGIANVLKVHVQTALGIMKILWSICSVFTIRQKTDLAKLKMCRRIWQNQKKRKNRRVFQGTASLATDWADDIWTNVIKVNSANHYRCSFGHI